MFSDGLSITDSRNPYTKHAQLCSNDGKHGVGCSEKENCQQGELNLVLDVFLENFTMSTILSNFIFCSI